MIFISQIDSSSVEFKPIIDFTIRNFVIKSFNEIFDKTGYVIDTHTAVAASAYKEYRKNTNDETVSVIVSTASPYKFTRSVLGAIEGKKSDEEDFVLIDRLSEISNMQIPKAVEDIRNAKVLHDTVCEIDEMKNEIAKFLSL